MMGKAPHATRVRAVLAWSCLTFATGIVPAGEVPDRSQGWQIPEGAERERNPVPVDAAVIASGQRLYRSKCQRCHGLDGTGSGPYAESDHTPCDMTYDGRSARNPDGVMFYKIWNGRAKPKMPAMKLDLARSDVWLVIQYAKTFRQ